MNEEFDDNEFSYSFWVEQHQIIQEKYDILQKKLEIALRALDDLDIVMFGKTTVTYHDMLNWHSLVKQTIAEIKTIK